MTPPRHVILDDHLLIEELLIGLNRGARPVVLRTTTYWYYRSCRAAVAGAGGHLSGPFAEVGGDEQERAILSLLELRDDIVLPDPRRTVPLMAEIGRRRPTLNVLNLEAVAAARTESADIWLSAQGARGILPSVLDEEGVAWRTLDVG